VERAVITVIVGSGRDQDIAEAPDAESALLAAWTLFRERGTRAGYLGILFLDQDGFTISSTDGAGLYAAARAEGLT